MLVERRRRDRGADGGEAEVGIRSGVAAGVLSPDHGDLGARCRVLSIDDGPCQHGLHRLDRARVLRHAEHGTASYAQQRVKLGLVETVARYYGGNEI